MNAEKTKKTEPYYQIRSTLRLWSGTSVCSVLPEVFRNIVFRAWEVLDRSKVDLEVWEQLYQNVDEILGLAYVGDPFNAKDKDEIPVDDTYAIWAGSENHIPLTLPVRVYMRRSYFEAHRIIQHPWPQWFAAMALASADEALTLDEMIRAAELNAEDMASYRQFITHRAAEGIEALAIAEQLKWASRTPQEKSRDAIVKRARSDQASTAADIRHAKSNEIKWRYFNALDLGPDAELSRAEAARRFYRALPEEDARLICPTKDEDNAVRTLTRFVRDVFKKY